MSDNSYKGMMSKTSQFLNSSSDNALLVVAKRPFPGQTKTRLTPPLSAWDAARLYECMLRDTIHLMEQVSKVDRYIAYLPETDEGYFRDLAPNFNRILQVGDDLGSRLDHSLTHCLSMGYQRVAIMNSDGPTLPPLYLASAFEILKDKADIVLGPSQDGGYYLIGLKKPAPRLLREVRMSTPYVLNETLAIAVEEGLRIALLPAWYDVDDTVSLSQLIDELKTDPNVRAKHTRAFLLENDWFAS